MPSPAWEDLDEFTDPDEFGAVCVISFRAGGTRTINVIFDDPHVTARAGEYERDDRLPRAGGKESDMVGVHRFDTCAITFKRPNGTSCTQSFDIMKDPEAEGAGWCYLELSPRVASEL